MSGVVGPRLSSVIQPEFIMLVKTDNAGTSASDQFTIPTTVATYNYDVDWGDGTTDTGVTGVITHTFAGGAGTYTVKISGIFPRIQFNNSGDKLKLLEVQNWGNIVWGNLNEAFRGCTNLDVTATDTPNLLNCTTLRQAFRDCSSLVGNSSFNTWDLSPVGNLDSTFLNCVNLNIDVPDWDVSNVIDFGFTFSFCLVFNSDLSGWDVSNASFMDFTFRGASLFNQNLGAWSLRTAGVNLSTIFRDSGMSVANYTDTIVGWANYVFTSGGPLNVNMTSQTAMTFDTSKSGGANFANAGAARTYLTTATPTGAGWTISSDTVI